MTIDTLVAALPEIYQPIYGHSEYDTRSSRPCADRLALVLSVQERMTRLLGRKPRVLDLGCAQGFFSLHLAANGSEVLGIDRLQDNIDLCRALALEHPDLNLRFKLADVVSAVTQLQPGEIDLILAMSVVHHLCAENGMARTRDLMRIIARNTGAALFELALSEEPAAWATSLPVAPGDLIADFDFFTCVGEFPTHLSEHHRPVYFASSLYFLQPSGISTLGKKMSLAHEYDDPALQRGRRYFFGTGTFLKFFRFCGDHADLNRRELAAEADFLQRSDIACLGYPKLLDCQIGKDEGWVFRECVSGELLSTALLQGKPIDGAMVIGELLTQLAALEELGYFHEDLRAWNILLRTENRPMLLDYGSLVRERRDREFNLDWRIPLLILLAQISRHEDPFRWPPALEKLSPSLLPPQIGDWVGLFWDDPAEGWNWRRLADAWSQHCVTQAEHPAPTLAENLAAQLSLQQGRQLGQMNSRLQALEQQTSTLTQRIQKWDQRLSFLRPLFSLANRVLPYRQVASPTLAAYTAETVAPCPVCRRGLGLAYSGTEWGGHPDYLLNECQACGSAYTVPLPDDTVLKHIYGSVFDYRWYQDHYDAKLKDCCLRVKEYGPLLGKRVLDFGGGMGYFSKAVAEAGMESVTYDPYVNAAPPAAKGWDTVVALHVLEHSNDLERTLSEIKGFLAAGGRLILAVPNFASRGYKEKGMAWVWAQPPLVHVFHFTATGLKALLERHGFTDIRTSFHERWDANLYCDLALADQYLQRDALWSLRPFNRFATYRRWVARRNAKLRFTGLKEALRDYDPQSDIYAELQVTAVLRA